jgi:intracellular septation protein A
MTVTEFLKEPLQGKTSLSKVIWLYGVVGSLLFGAIELFLNPENQFVMHVYTILGLFFGVYITVATYLCAKNCKSLFLARFVRVSAVISLVLLPVLTYLELTGALTLTDLMQGQLPE